MEVLFGRVYECRVGVGEQVSCGWTIYGREEYTCELQPYLPSLPTLPSFVSSDLHQMNLAMLFLSSLRRYKSLGLFSPVASLSQITLLAILSILLTLVYLDRARYPEVRPRVRHRPTDEPDN